MTLKESIDFDDKYTNAKISGLDKGGCVTRYESPFNSFGCIKNNQFKPIEK